MVGTGPERPGGLRRGAGVGPGSQADQRETGTAASRGERLCLLGLAAGLQLAPHDVRVGAVVVDEVAARIGDVGEEAGDEVEGIEGVSRPARHPLNTGDASLGGGVSRMARHRPASSDSNRTEQRVVSFIFIGRDQDLA